MEDGKGPQEVYMPYKSKILTSKMLFKDISFLFEIFLVR